MRCIEGAYHITDALFVLLRSMGCFTVMDFDFVGYTMDGLVFSFLTGYCIFQQGGNYWLFVTKKDSFFV